MKQLFAILFFIAVSNAIANPMCVSFCTECKEKQEDAACAKIDSTCSCTALLDSIRLEEERKAAEQERLRIEAEQKLALKKVQIQKIADVLIDSCQKSFCAFEFFMEADTLKKMNSTIDSSITKPEEEIVLPPMNAECKEFCAMCPTDSNSTIQDTSFIAMCNKIEEQCQCILQAELAKKAEMEKKLLYLETAKKTAEVIYEYCNNVPQCSTLITLRKETLDIVEFRAIPKKETPVVKQVPKPQTTPNKVTPKKPQKPKNLKENKKEKTFYSGISLNIGDVDRQSYFEDFDENEDGIIGGIGYLARWYFYSAGSFQLGINALVESVTLAEAEYSYLDFNVDQISLVAEIPIELRFGIPLSEYFAPFVSFSLNARKYIYGWFKYEMENSWLYNDATEDGFYESGDIDFLYFLGIGIEITKHFAIQYQWLISGIGWRSGYEFDYDEDVTNRFSLDFAF